MPRSNDPADLIGLIYEAAVDASAWPGVADRLADLCGAASAHLLFQDFDTLKITNVTRRYDPEVVLRFAEHWAHRNPLQDAVSRTPAGSIFTFDTVMPREELGRTAIYNEFFVPAGMAETLASRLLAEGPLNAAISLFRPAGKDAFGRRDERLLAGIVPHLQRALRLHLRLAEAGMRRDASAEMLDRIAQAAVLVDSASRVLFANRAAEEILAGPAGLRRAADGTLHGGRQADTDRLHRLVADAAAHPAGGAGDRIRLPRGGTRAPLTVVVAPLRAATDWLAVPRKPAAILFVSDPERGNGPTAERLQRAFGLTRAEAAVAIELLNGHGLRAAAGALGVAQVTVRTHLTAVFGKTDTRRQAELVRVLLQHGSGIRDG